MKIKTFFLIVCAFTLFFARCEKEDVFTETGDNSALKSSEVKWIPIVAHDAYVVVTNYYQNFPSQGICGGIMTHLGKLQPEKSIWYTSGEVSPDPENPGFLIWPQTGDWCAANGDLLHWTIETHLDQMNFTVYGTAIFDGGTGRFEKAIGEFNLRGHVDLEDLTRFIVDEGVGVISNVGSNK